MDDAYWERCPYYAEDECPHSSLVDRVYLIPHLLGPSDIDEVKSICKKCGLYLDEKRKYIRLKKRFKVVLIPDNGDVRLNGEIVNVSGVGALIVLEEWSDFMPDQRVELEIYLRHNTSKEVNAVAIKVTGEIKRINDEDKQVAIMFLKEVKQEYLLEL